MGSTTLTNPADSTRQIATARFRPAHARDLCKFLLKSICITSACLLTHAVIALLQATLAVRAALLHDAENGMWVCPSSQNCPQHSIVCRTVSHQFSVCAFLLSVSQTKKPLFASAALFAAIFLTSDVP